MRADRLMRRRGLRSATALAVVAMLLLFGADRVWAAPPLETAVPALLESTRPYAITTSRMIHDPATGHVMSNNPPTGGDAIGFTLPGPSLDLSGQLIRPDGTKVATAAIAGFWHSWSPDLSRQAAVNSSGVFVAIGTHSPVRVLPYGFGDLTWSRDNRLAFSVYSGAIVVTDPGSVTIHIVGRGTFPSFSPDGTMLAFRDCVTNGPTGSGSGNIDVVGVDGSGLRSVGSGDCGHSDPPSWTPDGLGVVYDYADAQGNCAVLMTSRQTAVARRLTSDCGSSPSVSPDGTSYAMLTGAGLVVRPLTGSGSQKAVWTNGVAAFAWAPDGKRFAILEPTSVGVGRVLIVGLDGTVKDTGALASTGGAHGSSFSWLPGQGSLTTIGLFVASSSRSSLLAIPNPGTALTVKNVALAGLITLLLFALVAFPSTLFNNTLESNIDVFRRWLPRWMRARERPPGQVAPSSFWHTNQGYLTFVLIAGLLYSRMQPGFGVNRGTFQTFLAFLVSVVVTTSIGITVTRRYVARRLHGTGHLEVELGTLVFAVVCVVASRLADFVPGYFYGIVAIFVATTQPSDEDKGRMAVIATSVTLSVAVVAWLLFSPLDHVASSGNLFAQLPRSLAGGLFSGGAQALAIGLTPIRFLPGATLKRWNKKLWGVFYAAGLFLFSLGLLHPGLIRTREKSVAWTLALALTFGLGSIEFWYYFRRRADTAAHPALSIEGTEAGIDQRDRVAEIGPSRASPPPQPTHAGAAVTSPQEPAPAPHDGAAGPEPAPPT